MVEATPYTHKGYLNDSDDDYEVVYSPVQEGPGRTPATLGKSEGVDERKEPEGAKSKGTLLSVGLAESTTSLQDSYKNFMKKKLRRPVEGIPGQNS